MPIFGDARLPARFWAKVQVNHLTSCWEWTASRRDGYGRYKAIGNRLAHRVSYEALVDEIPTNLQLDHTCRVRHCVNPAHLEPVTQRENVLRGVGVTARNAHRDACPEGHPYNGDNLYQAPNGNRVCRICREAARQRYRNKTTAA